MRGSSIAAWFMKPPCRHGGFAGPTRVPARVQMRNLLLCAGGRIGPSLRRDRLESCPGADSRTARVAHLLRMPRARAGPSEDETPPSANGFSTFAYVSAPRQKRARSESSARSNARRARSWYDGSVARERKLWSTRVRQPPRWHSLDESASMYYETQEAPRESRL